MPDKNTSRSTTEKAFRAALIIVVGAALVGAFVALRNTGLLARSVNWARELGAWAPAAFVILYVMAVLLSVPASVLTVGGGFVFGMAWGSAYVFLGATIGANLAFILGRHFARD